MTTRISILLVDDLPGTRDMLREALDLEDGIQVIGEAGGGHEAIALTDALKPDVVLMDIRMPSGDGVEACRAITSLHAETLVVALTWSDDPSMVRAMLAAGAAGYVVKGGTIDELLEAVRRAARGETALDATVRSGIHPADDGRRQASRAS